MVMTMNKPLKVLTVMSNCGNKLHPQRAVGEIRGGRGGEGKDRKNYQMWVSESLQLSLQPISQVS